MTQPTHDKQFRSFLLVLRQALLMVCKWIEREYIDTKSATQPVGFGAKSSTHEG